MKTTVPSPFRVPHHQQLTLVDANAPVAGRPPGLVGLPHAAGGQPVARVPSQAQQPLLSFMWRSLPR